MPATSEKQKRFMQAVSHNPAFAKKVGVSQKVGKEFDHFAQGGAMKKIPPFLAKETKAEEAKEMKVKAVSPALYRKGEKAEGIHGKSAKPKPFAKGGATKKKGC